MNSPVTRLWRVMFPVVLLALMSACSTDSFGRLKKQVARAVEVLQRDQDPDSLAAAALVRSSYMFGNDPDSALALIARATAAAPDRADLAWLHTTICQQRPSCDPQPLEARLRALDPANGAAWLGEVDRAWTRKDAEATNKALRAISQTAQVNIYTTTLKARLIPKIAGAASIALDEASVAVTGALAGETVSSYPSVSHACKGDRLAQADVLVSCQGVASAFEDGDSFTTEMVGVVIAKRVWPEDSPQWKAAADARRVYEYRSKLVLEVDAASGGVSIDRYLALCGQYPREQDVLRAELVEAGKNPDPPQP
jgi:hypothetical protein